MGRGSYRKATEGSLEVPKKAYKRLVRLLVKRVLEEERCSLAAKRAK